MFPGLHFRRTSKVGWRTIVSRSNVVLSQCLGAMRDSPARSRAGGIFGGTRIMRSTLILSSALGLLLGCGRGADRTADRGATADQTGTDTMVSGSAAPADTANDAGLNWGPAPPGLPAGARVAVVSGDPGKAGPFTVRIDMAADYKIRPHYHPTAETLRLIEGPVHFGPEA